MQAGSLSYVAESDTGHMTLMHARLQRLHESMRARGASAASIARLPRLPVLAKPFALPPIRLAHANIAAPYRDRHEYTPASRRVASLEKARERAGALARLTDEQRALGSKVTRTLCALSGLTREAIWDRGKNLYRARVRMIGILALHRLGFSQNQAAAYFDRDKASYGHALEWLADYLEQSPELQQIKDRLTAAFPGGSK